MPILGVIASSTRQGLVTDTGSMIPLSTLSIGTAVSNVTFTNIPNTYAHLQLRVIGRTSAGYDSDAINLQFNSDAGNNYVVHFLTGDTVNVSSSNSTAQPTVYVASRLPGSTVSANIFGAGIIDILDYTDTNKFTTVRHLSGFDPNSTSAVARIALGSGLWRNTAAITSIKVSANSGNLQPYSQFALYGIKSA